MFGSSLSSKTLSHQITSLTVQIGVTDKVTIFTASDFGRTLAENGEGSDYDWGGTRLVVGAVKGGRIYATPPAVGGTPATTWAGGRLIPRPRWTSSRRRRGNGS